MTEKLYGGIEGGGTKFNCAIGSGPENIVSEARFPTTTPAETIGQVCEFFAPYVTQLHGIGLGSFGPFDVYPSSSTYGYITTTPKPHWGSADVRGMLREKLDLPFAVDDDSFARRLGREDLLPGPRKRAHRSRGGARQLDKLAAAQRGSSLEALRLMTMFCHSDPLSHRRLFVRHPFNQP